MSDQTTKPKIDPARLAAVLDAGTIAAGIIATAVGVALYDWRAGVVALGALLLVAELAAALVRR